MPKYIIVIGTDILGIVAKNKKSIHKSLDKCLSEWDKKYTRCTFKSRTYSYNEVWDANVFSLQEFFKERKV